MGFKYSVSFRGTPNFASPEMASLFFKDEKDYVDIYYNDVFCLVESIKYMKKLCFYYSLEKEMIDIGSSYWIRINNNYEQSD